jgi:hypothetical protein
MAWKGRWDWAIFSLFGVLCRSRPTLFHAALRRDAHRLASSLPLEVAVLCAAPVLLILDIFLLTWMSARTI